MKLILHVKGKLLTQNLRTTKALIAHEDALKTLERAFRAVGFRQAGIAITPEGEHTQRRIERRSTLFSAYPNSSDNPDS